QINLENSKIAMENAQNSFNDTERKYNDYKTMLAAGVITQKDFDAVELGYTQARNALTQTQNAYNSAETSLHQAQESLSLYNEKTIQDSTASAKNGVAAAEASRDSIANSLGIAKSNLNYIEVKSPIDGVITERNIEPTNMVSSGMAPFVVADTSKVTVDVEVSERIINTVNLGQKINVNINAVYDKPVSGVIKTINPVAAKLGSFTVKIEIDNADGKLKPGMIANVSFVETSAQNVVVVPRSTVIEDGDVRFVYVTDGRTATKKFVQTGVDDGENVEISGVELGEKVIISGQNYVTDGGPVTIAQDEADKTEKTTAEGGKEE
ncbi:MAG: efflux RND transporter periplasmic adaptor subunit, partial [Firmicutes bacterium]|nr:efflux RND transporter periplasmic adaptor subunit [Bacillota bacterium]